MRLISAICRFKNLGLGTSDLDVSSVKSFRLYRGSKVTLQGRPSIGDNVTITARDCKI